MASLAAGSACLAVSSSLRAIKEPPSVYSSSTLLPAHRQPRGAAAQIGPRNSPAPPLCTTQSGKRENLRHSQPFADYRINPAQPSPHLLPTLLRIATPLATQRNHQLSGSRHRGHFSSLCWYYCFNYGVMYIFFL